MSDNRTLPFRQPDPMRLPPRYAELRTDEPVARVRTPDGQHAWLVTSYDAVSTVLSDQATFGVNPPGTPTDQNDTLLVDGDAHARLRRLVGKAFTARAITELRPRILRLADERVAAMKSAGPPADLVNALGAPMAITAIAELLGVEIADRDRFRTLADAMSISDPFGYETDPEAGLRAWQDLTGYMAELVAAKRQHLGDDLMSRLISVRDAEDGQLTDGELIALAGTIVAAGYLTACNAISIGTLLLLDEDGLGQLHDDPDGLPDAIEEVLRTMAGLNGETFPRWALRNTTLAGTGIAVGDLVLVRLGAANRDPARFAEPERFQPERFRPERSAGQAGAATHLAFGRGPHYCLGASLARVEVTAALGALARELPGLRLVGSAADVEWIRSQADSGPAALRVTW